MEWLKSNKQRNTTLLENLIKGINIHSDQTDMWSNKPSCWNVNISQAMWCSTVYTDSQRKKEKPPAWGNLTDVEWRDLQTNLKDENIGKTVRNRICYTLFFFFYKNIFYKNIEAQICEILRIF